VHVDLHQRLLADALEAVNLSCLDDQNISRTGFELLPVDYVVAAAFSQELDLVIGMAMRAGTPPRQGPEQEHGNIHATLVGSHELVRAALERKILLANPMHAASVATKVKVERLPSRA